MSLPTHSPSSETTPEVEVIEFDPNITYGATEIACMDFATRQMLVQAAILNQVDVDWEALNAAQGAGTEKRKSVFAIDDDDDGFAEVEREEERQVREDARTLKREERQRKRLEREIKASTALWTLAAAGLLIAGGAGYVIYSNSSQAATPTPVEALLEGAQHAYIAVPSDSVTDVRVRPSEVASSASDSDADAEPVAEGVVRFGGDDR